jgi:hypothetical protein
LCNQNPVFYVRPAMHSTPSDEASRTWNTVIGLVGIALLACASSTIEGRGGGAFAPANERRGGSLRYYEGTKSRDDAYREMFTYCSGPYEISDERDLNRGVSTQYNRYSYNSTTTTMIEHIIDFRCVDQPRAAPTVRLTGDEWRLSRDYVAQNSGCPSATVEHEVASPTPGAKGYAVSACGQRWLCSAGNGMAVCGVDGAPPPTANGWNPGPPPPAAAPIQPPPQPPAELAPVPAL